MSGPTVVLLDAGVGDSRLYDSVVEKLSDRFRLILYDNRGYGESPPPTVSFSQLGDLVTVLDHFELDRVHMVGCSMGGQTVIDGALAHPSRVSSLVLLAPRALSGYDWPDDAAAEEAIADGDVTPSLDSSSSAAGRPTPIPSSIPLSGSRPLPRPAAGSPRSSNSGRNRPVDRLGDIAQPTILTTGLSDLIAENVTAVETDAG